jgi:amidase
VSEHALTRSVRDSAARLDATAGPDVGDPYSAPPPARPFRAEVGADPGRLRIAFTTEASNGAPVHEDCVRAVREAAALCASLGHEVTEGAPTLDEDVLTRAFMARLIPSLQCSSCRRPNSGSGAHVGVRLRRASAPGWQMQR